MAVLLRAAIRDQHNFRVDRLTPKELHNALAAGLGPILRRATRLSSDNTLLPLPTQLLSADLTARVVTAAHLDALEEILRAFGSDANSTVLLKGISICQTHYAEPHLRPMSDIDLLVPRNRLADLEALLRDLGYRQASTLSDAFFRTHHHSMPFYHAARGVCVELHRSLLSPRVSVMNGPLFSDVAVFSQTVPYLFRNLRCRVLSEELQIPYTCTHWAQNFNPPRGLFPLLDVSLLVNRAQRTLDWDKLLCRLDRHSAVNHVALIANYLHDNGLAEFPPAVRTRLNQQATAINKLTHAMLTRMVDHYVMRSAPFGRFATETNVCTIWNTLLVPQSSFLNLATVPYRILCPRIDGRAPSLRFQFRRIFSALGLRKPTGN